MWTLTAITQAAEAGPMRNRAINGRHVAEVDLVKGRHHGNGEFQGHEGAGNCSQHTGVNKFQNTPFSL